MATADAPLVAAQVPTVNTVGSLWIDPAPFSGPDGSLLRPAQVCRSCSKSVNARPIFATRSGAHGLYHQNHRADLNARGLPKVLRLTRPATTRLSEQPCSPVLRNRFFRRWPRTRYSG
jgi:hypothetical protein